jgi:epoxyqueuosine reductase
VLEHIEWALNQLNKKIIDKNTKMKRLIRIVEKGLPRDA